MSTTDETLRPIKYSRTTCKDFATTLKKRVREYFKENNIVVKNYLANSFLDDTEDSFFKDIKSVQPANIIEISNLEFKFEKYWSLRHSEKCTLNKDEVVNRYKKALEIHTISDVPIAYTLSGGIDSSLIATWISFL